MQLTVSGKQLDITPALQAHVAGKMDKISRHFDHIIRAQVVLHIEKTRHTAEATINARGATLHATAAADNMYAAIDAMLDKLDRQIIKHKEKHRAPVARKH